MNQKVYLEDYMGWVDESKLVHWLEAEMKHHELDMDLVYVFMSDEDLLVLNKQHLNHDTLTDIITYDFRPEGLNEANLCLSFDRLVDNALHFGTSKEEELIRVCAHGLLHLVGFNDKTPAEISLMREQEQLSINRFHVEH